MSETPLLAGHYYHIYNRGNNGKKIFFEERNYAYFFNLYIKYIYPIAETYAYCLMKNHFHLLVRLKTEKELQDCWKLQDCQSLKDWQSFEQRQPFPYSQAFSNLFSTYTKTINKSYQRSGSLFEKPFKRILIDSDTYLTHLICYIHRNPQTHGFVDSFQTYIHSSYQTILENRQSRLAVQQVLAWFGNLKNFLEYHEQFDVKTIQHLHLEN